MSGGDTPSAPLTAEDQVPRDLLAAAESSLGLGLGGRGGAGVGSASGSGGPGKAAIAAAGSAGYSDRVFTTTLLLSVDCLVEVPEESELALSYKKRGG